MKIDRRGFIKFAVGAVVGVHLTPIPWKMMDDVAIWTQNWPWVPDPENGANSYRNIAGSLTDCGCGLRVRLIDNKRAVTVGGNPDHPLSRGGLCPMCASSLQYFYNKGVRITSPMKKDGDTWKSISWDEGLKLLVDKLKAERSKGGPDKAALLTGGADTATNALLRRFMAAYGSPNVMHMPSMEDTNRMILDTMFGLNGTMGYDLEQADFVVSFGSGLIEGWGSTVYSMTAFEKWRKNPPGSHTARLVQVEPNLSTTAAKADKWLAVRPGSEAALALGMAHVIIKEKLYNAGSLNNTFGFDDVRDQDGKPCTGFKNLVLKDYSPGAVARITGLPETEIVSLARAFAKADRPLALAGKGKGETAGSFYEFMAIFSLNALVGAVDRTGGAGFVPRPPLAEWPEPELDSVASKGLSRPRIDGAGSSYPFSGSLLNRFVEAVNQEHTSPINVLLVDGSNPSFAAPNAGEFNKALEKIPFVVCFSSFWDETAHKADLLLPSPTFLESWDDKAGARAVPFPIYQVTMPVFKPLFDTRPAGEVIMNAARALGGSIEKSFPWKDMENTVKSRAAGLFKTEEGMLAEPGSQGASKSGKYRSEDDFWKALALTGCWYNPGKAVGKSNVLYGTPSGKLELYSLTIKKGLAELVKKQGKKALRNLGVNAAGDSIYTAHLEETERFKQADQEAIFSSQGFTQVFMMPYQLMYVNSTGLASAPFLTKIFPDTLLSQKDMFVAINPQTASLLTLSEGDKVTIKSGTGRITARVHLFEGVRPGVAAVPEGFGHTAFDKFMKDKGGNARAVMEVESDPLSGLPLVWGTRVNLVKIQPRRLI